jgi:hypothetical protein
MYKEAHQKSLDNLVVKRVKKSRTIRGQTHSQTMWGLFTKVDIPKNSFILEYTGEVISNETAEIRGKKYDKENLSYLFDVAPMIDEEYMECFYRTMKDELKVNISKSIIENDDDLFPLV